MKKVYLEVCTFGLFDEKRKRHSLTTLPYLGIFTKELFDSFQDSSALVFPSAGYLAETDESPVLIYETWSYLTGNCRFCMKDTD